MQPESISLVQRTSLLASIALVGRERPAIHSHGALSYARVSKSIQQSIEAQLRCNLQTGQRLGVPVVHELQDKDSGLNPNRPGYVELLRLAETGHYSHVLVFKADRLSRDDAEFVTTVRKLLHMGMKIEDYTIGPITEENAGLLALLAYMELRANSQRTTMKLKDLAENGKKLGLPRYGYVHTDVSGIYKPDPAVAPVITELFERAERGESISSLRRWFNDALGLRRTNAQIVEMLHCEYYKGLNVNCKVRRSKLEQNGKPSARPKSEWAVTFHDAPLIDEPTWERVQARLRLHDNVGQHRDSKVKYALTGLLWCGRCQRRMRGHSKPGRSKVYTCNTCGVERGLLKVERSVLGLLRELPIRAEQIAHTAVGSIDAQRAKLEQELAALDADQARLTNRRVNLGIQCADGEMTRDEYRAAIVRTDGQRQELRSRRLELEAQIHGLPATSELSARIVERLRGMDPWTELAHGQAVELAQELYRECVTRATYDPVERNLSVEWTPHIAPFMPSATQASTI